MLREVEDAIIDILRSDQYLSSRVAAWYRGFPRSFEKYPYIVVNWVGGAVRYTGRMLAYHNSYEVIVVDLKPDSEEAELSVMELSERVYSALRVNPTLNGTVDGSKPVRWDAEGIPSERGSLKGARIIVEALKFLV